MQSIIIPPITFLHSRTVADQKMHLLLSHLLDTEEYFQFYHDRRRAGDYLILDNSAHEHGKGQSIEVLVEQSCDLWAQEAVLPDVLFDCQGTIESTTEALEYLTTNSISPLAASSWMMVPQGGTFSEWIHCLGSLVQMFRRAKFKNPSVLRYPVIGISKDYSEKFENFEECIAAALSFGYPVHLLGWPKPLATLRWAARRWPQIRSTDSGRPFTFAFAGVKLPFDVSDEVYPGRQPDFFTRLPTTGEIEAAEHNVAVYRYQCDF